MKREIKFRCWDEGNKKMFTDVQFVKSGDDGNDWIVFSSYEKRYKIDKGNIVFDNPYCRPQIILMQFTGLKDKNGKAQPTDIDTHIKKEWGKTEEKILKVLEQPTDEQIEQMALKEYGSSEKVRLHRTVWFMGFKAALNFKPIANGRDTEQLAPFTIRDIEAWIIKVHGYVFPEWNKIQVVRLLQQYHEDFINRKPTDIDNGSYEKRTKNATKSAIVSAEVAREAMEQLKASTLVEYGCSWIEPEITFWEQTIKYLQSKL